MCQKSSDVLISSSYTGRPNTLAKIKDLKITIISDDYSVAFNENDEADISIFTSLSNPLPTQVAIKNITLPQGVTAIDASKNPITSSR